MNNGKTLTGVGNEHLFAELDEILRTMPDVNTLKHKSNETLMWLGRVGAAMQHLGPVYAMRYQTIQATLNVNTINGAQQNMAALVHEAYNFLRLQIARPIAITVDKGSPHDFFDEVRKVIETAINDILFVDPYMDADFIAKYLPFVKNSASVRLLGRKNIEALQAATLAFVAQHGLKAEVRASSDLHDRWVFIDTTRCFQSGTSFRDGGVKATTAFIESRDACGAMIAQYEKIWAGATVPV